MSKRILSQSLKHPKQRWKENLVDQSSAWTKIRDVVVTLGAISGVITGVLWLGGRFYAFGYFGRMAVPIYFLNFPFGEYAENYIIYTFSDIIAFFASHWLLLLITIVIGVALAILLIWYFRKQYTKEAIRATILRIENWNNRVLVGSLIILFLFSFLNAYHDGDRSAYYTLTHSQSVTIYSKSLLPLGNPSVVTAPDQNSSLYKFDGFYLLTYNNGKYYLFEELNLDTCKPKEVYVVSDSETISIIMSNIDTTSFTCLSSPNISSVSYP